MTRPLALLLLFAVTLAAACSAPPEGTRDLEPLGDFRLGYTVAVARDPTIGPLSRVVPDEEWEAAMEAAIARQFGSFEGERLYHIAVKVQGYIVAVPGIPIVAAPKSTMIFTVSVWDGESMTKLNRRPRQIQVIETLSGENLFSSGLTKSRQEQVTELSRNAAGEILEWMRNNRRWFERPPPEAPAALPASPPATPPGADAGGA